MERLDPQRRELLEARILGKQVDTPLYPNNGTTTYTGSSGSESNDSSASATMTTDQKPTETKTSDLKPKIPQNEKSRTPPPTKGRKRKGMTPERDGVNKATRPLMNADRPAPPGIGGFFRKDGPKSPSSNYSPTQGRNASFSNLRSSPALQRQGSAPVVTDIAMTSRCTQTDLTAEDLLTMEKQTLNKDFSKDNVVIIQELKREITQLEQQLHNQLASEKKMKEKNLKSIELIKEFLVQQTIQNKKKCREDTMRNRLRLGQFNTVRQGASFVEQWTDGYAFAEINKKLSENSQAKDEMDKQRKMLQKRKPPSEAKQEKDAKKTKVHNDGFTRPGNPPTNFLTFVEYHEQEEILRLRSNAIKKEEQELQADLERLERERNIHIRELKRIHNEDQSRFNHHPILNDRYLLLHMIGKGGFSEVFKGFDLKAQHYVACKVHQLNKDWKEDKKANYIKHAVREYTIHRSLNHPRIVRLYDVFEIDSNSFVTVLEHCDGNDLDFMLKQQKMIPEKEARVIMMQVVSALKYLNERKPPVIHYDLKPGNILLGSGVMAWDVKLTDFGLSKILPEESDTDSMDLTSQGAGTYWYLPPECFVVGQAPPKISSKVDVWSVGIIFYQALYGRKPFGHNLSQASILEQNTILKATNIDFPGKPTVSQEAKNFIRKCLTYKKEERVDVITLAEDPYLKPKRTGSAAAAAAAAAAANRDIYNSNSPQADRSNTSN